MANIIRDSMDFSAYMRATEPAAKVRAASAFFDDVMAEFAERPQSSTRSAMISTKLCDVIEFRPAEVTAWTGYSGHRKSMFTSQVALDLCVQRERCLLVSLEMTPARTLARMARQAYGGKPGELWLREFGKWTDGRLWLFDHVGRISPTLCIAVCNYFAAELKGRHVFVDSMMMVCASEESMDEQKQFVTDLCRAAQETGLHVHLVTHCRKPQTGEDRPPSKYDVRGSAAISDQVANVITIWQNKPKRAALQKDPNDAVALAAPDARVCIEKQRNGEWEGSNQLWFDERSMRFMDDRHSAVESYVLLA